MRQSVLSLSPQTICDLDRYALHLSSGVSPLIKQHFEWTQETFADADRSSSLLQAQWLSDFSKKFRPHSILDIGCYTGLSAIAWHEGTKETNAKIHTIERDHELAATARQSFERLGCEKRIKVLEGSAEDILVAATEPYDLIFIDLEFAAYLPITRQILDAGLLSRRGCILVDNVFARGFAVTKEETANVEIASLEHWVASGEIVRRFNDAMASDPRVEVVMYPIFDGLSEIRWRV